jgi:hypothetical protein
MGTLTSQTAIDLLAAHPGDYASSWHHAKSPAFSSPTT